MLSTRAKVIIAIGAVGLFLAILWVAAWAPGKETVVVDPAWSGTMVVQTKAVQVDYDGRGARCVSDEVYTPGHFEVRVTNSAEMPLVCDVAVQAAQVSGYMAGDPAWLQVGPAMAIPRQLTGDIPVRVALPANVTNGQYALDLVLSKGQQVGSVLVVFEVQKKVAA